MANDEIRDYSFDNNTATLNGKPVDTKTKVTSDASNFIGRVFLTMFIGLIITFAVAVGLGYLVAFFAKPALEAGNADSVLTGLVVAYIVSAVGIIILSFVIPITFARGKHNILVPGIIYCVLMGVIFTVIVLFTPILVLLYSLGITTVIFGVMALIGLLGRGKMKGLTIAIIGLMSGLLIMTLANIIFMLVAPDMFESFYWIISLGFFALVLLITVWDMRNIKNIAMRAEAHENNVVLYCAYIIYTDFISILIRVIYYLSIAMSKK